MTKSGQVYEQTCIHVPLEMKQQAKEAGINMAETFRNALAAEIKNRNHPRPDPARSERGGSSLRQRCSLMSTSTHMKPVDNARPRLISRDVLEALDPLYRATANVLIRRGEWAIIDETEEAVR